MNHREIEPAKTSFSWVSSLVVCAEMVWFKQNLIHTYMHTCRHAYPHACILHIHPCMHGSKYIYIYIYWDCIYDYICINCIYIYIWVCVCARACVCARIHMSMIPCWVASPCLAMDCCSLLFLFPNHVRKLPGLLGNICFRPFTARSVCNNVDGYDGWDFSNHHNHPITASYSNLVP